MRRKDKLEDDGHEAQHAPPPSTAAAMITPLDIQQKEFQVSRLGGYRMRDVDEFLDQLTDAMTAVLAENERLRGGGSGSPIVGSADLDEVNRQADEIIQRARDEATRIVADAERRASTTGRQDAGSVDAEGREAVDAFLEKERAFLQSLAALVQEHADGVKAMAREVRRRAATAEDAASDPGGSVPAPSGGGASAVGAAGGAPARQAPTRSAATGPSTEPEPTHPITPVPDAGQDEPIVVSEPAPARSRQPDDSTDGGEDGDESLRELFWGEEG